MAFNIRPQMGRWLVIFLLVVLYVQTKEISQIRMSHHNISDAFSKSFISRLFNNKNKFGLNNEGVPDKELENLRNTSFKNNYKYSTPRETSTISHWYVEEFDDETYLDHSMTTASGWGRGRIELGKELGSPIYMNNSFYAYDVYVIGEVAYLAEERLSIFNISDPLNPTILSYRDTSDRALGVYIKENYAYVAVSGDGLAIINISDPTNPGNPVYSAPIDEAVDVYVSGEFAYVSALDSGLAIINISNPNNPGIPIYRSTTSEVVDVYVSGEFAYVANWDRGLAIINITDPTNPGEPFYTNLEGGARGVFVSGDYAYVTDMHGLAIVNISDPTTARILSYQDDFAFYRDPQGVYVSGDYAFVADAQREGRLWLIDISNPTKPGKPIRRDLSDDALNVCVKGGYAYVACRRSGLAIIEVKRATHSVAQSTSIHADNGFVQNSTIYANQTIFPNTSITYQISSDGNTWIPVTLNDTYSFVANTYHGLYWRAELASNDFQLSPKIDSVRIDFDVWYDEEPPVITLVRGQNNTAVFPGTVIEFSFHDYLLDYSWFTWDEGEIVSLMQPWMVVCPPLEEGYHWLTLSANDSTGLQTTVNYRFYINYRPEIVLREPLNNVVIFPLTNIKLNVSDHTLINSWYHWDQQENITLLPPFMIKAINSSGWHVLTVGAEDSWNSRNSRTYKFYILRPAVIETIQVPLTTVYGGESFVFKIIITNLEEIPLNLTLVLYGDKDEILEGNDSHIVIHPGENATITLEIRPKHTSTHQLDLYLYYEESVYYHEFVQFNVSPYWISPTFLLPVLILIIFLLFLFLMTGIPLLYLRDQLQLQRLFQEQHTQLTNLIDQLTLSNLEIKIIDGVNGSEDSSIRPLGFPQHLQLSKPIDRETLTRQFYSLKEQIINGDPTNLDKLTDLLTQGEELLKESLGKKGA